jgi:two-component system cell cycle response regulator
MQAELEAKVPIRTTIKIYHKNGNEYWLDINIIPLRNDAGDHVIKSISALCQQFDLNQDHICRYGGEEINGLLPNTRLNEAMIIAERVRTKIEGSFVVVAHYNIKVTASFGISEFDVKDALPLEAKKRADKVLYQAKADGRNRVRSN